MRRLLCPQVLAAVQCWKDDLIDPVDADLVSVLVAGFPAHTGGVMSFIDTGGIPAFLDMCAGLPGGDDEGETLPWLQQMGTESGRIYPSLAE